MNLHVTAVSPAAAQSLPPSLLILSPAVRTGVGWWVQVLREGSISVPDLLVASALGVKAQSLLEKLNLVTHVSGTG